MSLRMGTLVLLLVGCDEEAAPERVDSSMARGGVVASEPAGRGDGEGGVSHSGARAG